jgi:hypothetical protein
MPFTVEIERVNQNVNVNVRPSLTDPKVYIDWVCQFNGICMHPEDTLTISWDVTVYFYEDGNFMNSKPITIRETFKFEKPTIVNFARLVHYKNKSRIYTYEELPKLAFPRK